ncbi:MAG: coenzyme F420-0:L-glutamate ligase [Oscillospiraceae bacterium]|nr:coenzyme F420-0:L-glutamate ligase [Oscillospiraceae bacterium]
MEKTRTVGTVIRGIRTPIIKQGDKLDDIITQSVLDCAEKENINFEDKDIVGVTEAVVARAQGNYVSLDAVGKDINNKFGDEVGVVFPMLSRNRFSLILAGIARGVKKCYVQLNYPNDEVGNPIADLDKMYEKRINPYSDEFTEDEFRQIFTCEERKNPFTGVDILDYYKNLSDNIKIIFSNNPVSILKYTKNVLVCDIHSRFRTKEIIKKAGAEKIYSLDEIMNESIGGSGYNEKYGVLGSNISDSNTLKLFPRDCENFVKSLAKKLRAATNRQIEVLIYGDGAFKDPQGKIWELADPVVSPAYTPGLEGVPNEVKLKYLADNQFKELKGEELEKAIKEYVKNKDTDLKASMDSQGTTPRKITDLLGSLCDLTSGSGDKGTPVVLIQGYFDNISS